MTGVAQQLGRWILPIDGASLPELGLIGGKAWSIARMSALGLPVPPAFVITTRACAHVLTHGAQPGELADELVNAVVWLEQRSGKTFGAGPTPLLVSVRSGAPVSMPGMMDTVLNLGINDETEALLAEACGDAAFARDTHRRFLDLFAQIVLKATVHLDEAQGPAAWRAEIARATGTEVPQDPMLQLEQAVRAVFESWNGRRARRYRDHHGIAHDLGTAVTVQSMVFGNFDERSGTGVLFSRNPLSGAREPYGEYLARAQGEDVVSGRRTPQDLASLHAAMPEAHAELLRAAQVLEDAAGDAQDIEFTIEGSLLYLLQTRVAKRAPGAAVRMAVEMVDEGRLTPPEALKRVSPEQVRTLLSPRLAEGAAEGARALAKGEAASPGVGTGVVVTDPDEAERRAAAGEAVILARATTSPEDVHGMIAARAIVTEQGGSTSHAAVVGRSLGRPCVVGCGAGALAALEGREVTVEGTQGLVFDSVLPVVAPNENDDPALARIAGWAREGARVKVLDLAEGEPGADPLEFDDHADTADQLLTRVRPGMTVKGRVFANDDALVRGAIAAGASVIVTRPVLPALLLAAHAAQTD